MKRFVFSALLLAAALIIAPASHAATTCSVTNISSVNFGTVDPTSGNVDVTATVDYSCTYSGGLLGGLYGVYISMCFNLAPDALGQFSPRTMANASGDRMQFQLYKDPGRTVVWGSTSSATYTANTQLASFTILANGQTQTGSLVVYARVPGLQSSLSPNGYTTMLTPNSLQYRFTEALLSIGTYPASCQAGGTGGATVAAPAMTINANVAATCRLGTASDLDFGSTPGLLTTALDRTSLLRMTCTNRAAWQVGLDNGQNASGTVRRMHSASGNVIYELYRDSQRTLRWGNTFNSDTATGAGNGNEQSLTVYGRVPSQAAVPAGNYSDVVTVTVTY